MACKDCIHCDKKGLLILPLRYSAVVGGAISDAGTGGAASAPSAKRNPVLDSIPSLNSKLGAGVKEISLSGQAKYAARVLREAYLYVLIERLGIKSWEGYLVLESTQLYQFPVDTPPQVVPQPFCNRDGTSMHAYMVAINNAEQVPNAWFLFTPDPMTEAKLAEYKKNPAGMAAAGKMQHFSPADWVKGSTSQPHTLLADEVHKEVVEHILYRQCGKALSSALGLEMQNQLFPPPSIAYAGTPPDGSGQYSGTLGSIYNSLKRNGGAAIVLYDHIGVTQELNDFRNAAFVQIETHLDKKDKYQVTNQRKLNIYERIQEQRVAIENGLMTDAQNAAAINDMKRRARIEPIFPDDTAQMKKFKMQANNAYQHPSRDQWEADHPEAVDQFDEAYAKELQELPERAREKAKKEWSEKYLPKLDVAEMKGFIDTLDAVIANAKAAAAARVDDHLKWVTSENLLSAFDVYDKEHAANGHAFEGQSALCTFGMTGVPKSAEQVNAWIKEMKVSRKNIYLRGYYMNQLEVEKAANEAIPQIQQMLTSVTSVDDLHGPTVLGVSKKLIDAFKKVDSAYDEWVRDHKQIDTKGWGASRAASVYAKVSELTRVISRAGITSAEQCMMSGVIGFMTYSRIGHITQQIGFDEFMIQVRGDEKQSKRLAPGYKGKPKGAVERVKRAARRATKSSITLVEDGMFSLIEDTRKKVREKIHLSHQDVLKAHEKLDAKQKADLKTNNYHQVRIGVALGVLEIIALHGKLSHFQASGRAWTELAGSVFSLGSVLCDIVYASVKSMREVRPYAKTPGLDKAADIVRGGWKAAAGVLGTFAGGAQVTLDILNLRDENSGKQRGFLMTIYMVRASSSAAGTAFGAIAAFSYAEPLLRYTAARTGSSGYLSAGRIAAWASTAKNLKDMRVLLLLRVARFNLIGLALTGVEIAYYGYIKFIADDALQSWCLRSTFRSKKAEANWLGVRKDTARYLTEEEEVDALISATQEATAGA